MSAEAKTEDKVVDTDVQKSEEGNPILAEIKKMRAEVTTLSGRMDTELGDLKKSVDEAKQVQYPHGAPGVNRNFQVKKSGEMMMASRPFSLMKFAQRLRMRAQNVPGWEDIGKIEADLSDRLSKAYYGSGVGWDGWSGRDIIPLGGDLLPEDGRDYAEDIEKANLADKSEVTLEGMENGRGVPHELKKECRDIMYLGGDGVDYGLLDYLGIPVSKASNVVQLRKDLSSVNVTTGAALIAQASQGELIELLRATEFFPQVGARELDLPPQGRITFPRVTGSVTISATTEGATITESTPATGELSLAAKPYTGLTDIPEELFKFATSTAVEAWLRSEFMKEIALKVDRDSINGPGGTSIQGIVDYANIVSRTAGTTGANGDTLDAPDPYLLFGDIVDNNAPVGMGFFYGMTGKLWAGLITRQATTNEFIHSVAAGYAGGGAPSKTLAGEKAVCSTQLPTNRSKGSASNLTLLLGGVGAEWLIARSGVVDIQMTNSDASKFQQRLSTMRGTVYIDAGPRHEKSFGMIDTLLNS